MNTYFLRFTENIEADLERGCSYHSCGFKKGFYIEMGVAETEEEEIQKVAEAFGCDVDEVTTIGDEYVQELPGLCAYEIEAEDLEEAIEEVENGDWGIFDPQSEGWVLMSGVSIDNCPEGVVIRPGKVLHEVKH